MLKRDELTNPASCMSRARDDEMTFVLLGRDAAAPVAIRAWISERIRLGKNQTDDAQILEAERCAERMEAERVAPPPATPAAPSPATVASPFTPLPPGEYRENAGTQCDMLVGPCACGAWHDVAPPPAAEAAEPKNPRNQIVAHLCCERTVRPYPSTSCSCCRSPSEGKPMTLPEVCEMVKVAPPAPADSVGRRELAAKVRELKIDPLDETDPQHRDGSYVAGWNRMAERAARLISPGERESGAPSHEQEKA